MMGSRTRSQTAWTVVALLALPCIALAQGPQAGENPESLATLQGLVYPALPCPFQMELDAGMVSMARPLLRQMLAGKADLPEPLAEMGMGPMLGQLGPAGIAALVEFLDGIQGLALALHAPEDGVDVAKIAGHYRERAMRAGWKVALAVNPEPATAIAIYQLPTTVPTSISARPPRGLVLVVVAPKQVIAAGMLGELRLDRLMVLLPMLKGMGK